MGYFFIKLALMLFWLFIGYTIIKAYSSLAPWVPVFTKDMDRVIELADLQEGEKILDLGCGNGKLCLSIARKTQGIATGIELAWPLYALCKFRQLIYNNKNLNFIFGDLYKEDLNKYDVLYVYGISKTLKNKLSQKILAEVQPGTRIISYCFEIPGLKPRIISQPTLNDLPIYYYVT